MIRLAKIIDVDLVIDFIRMEWKADHIFCRNRDFFLYQYQDGDMLNFILSVSDSNNINGILGFIKSSSNLQAMAWASIWKVSKNNGNSMLGLELMDQLRSMFPGKLSSVGINEKTIPLYKYLGIYTGTLQMFVMLNDKLPIFNIAKVNVQLQVKQFYNNDKYSLKTLIDNSFSLNNIQQSTPQKDEFYLSKRYFNHPIYSYQCYGIYKQGCLSSIFITRVQTFNNTNVLRIVDFIGNETDLKYVSADIYKILLENKLEYADFLCYGFKNDELLAANFLEVDLAKDDLIIPNYFSPFVGKNTTINFFADIPNLELLKICKADGDQDRPN